MKLRKRKSSTKMVKMEKNSNRSYTWDVLFEERGTVITDGALILYP